MRAGGVNRCATLFWSLTILLAAGSWPGGGVTLSAHERPIALSEVRRIVVETLADRRDYQPGDLISRSEVNQVLSQLALLGWSPDDRAQIEADTLSDSSSLVRILRTTEGRRFMRKVAGQEQVFDRLDRISQVAGGEALLQSLVKLPDGERFAMRKPPRGRPDLLDLLPKNASGKTRTIKDYDKRTGQIYSEADLIKRLEASYRRPPAGTNPTTPQGAGRETVTSRASSR